MDNDELLATISDRLAELANGKQKLNWLHYLATVLPLVVILLASAATLGFRLGYLETELESLRAFKNKGDRFTEDDGRRLENACASRMNKLETEVHTELRELRREIRSWHYRDHHDDPK